MATPPSPAVLAARRGKWLPSFSGIGAYSGVTHEASVPFGPALTVEAFRLGNGLRVLICEDHSAPVVAYHTWYRVGSRHEQVGKTGLAHLFEHLMFNETETMPAGELDRKLEEAGAESNASTWLDWTQYNIAIPRERLAMVPKLESERMRRLVLRDPQVSSEKEVVANERRYRVDDDVEGAVSELLWATAFNQHAYRWPTIGWMPDIEGFTTDDCRTFYDTFYAPNNATLVIVGDVTEKRALELVVNAYGNIAPSSLPVEDVRPEPPQTAERLVEVAKPTATEKLVIGYHSPALGDFDHPALSLLSEVLFGGRASRVHRRLVRQLEIAVDVHAFVGPFRDPGLFEVFASARDGKTAKELLVAVDEELERARSEPIPNEELERAKARLELSLVAGLETVEGKASTIGFYDTVIGRPASAFERLEATASLTASDLLRVARRYLAKESRTVILVHPQEESKGAAA
ncbi:MAG TPA: pitrilysin family protein [Polyangiaceae bacterium]|jgi:zinc protease|nr:pitrilysin family protein [Polyangiaceae bacterium]